MNIDLNNLSKDLYSKKIDHNLLLINCSIKKTFFKFNNKFENCPNFIIKNYNNDSYIFLNYKKNFFRLVKFSENISLRTIWIKLLDKNKTSYELSINPTNYNKLEYFTGLEPKILSYEQNNVILEFDNFFISKQINFLLNFF